MLQRYLFGITGLFPAFRYYLVSTFLAMVLLLHSSNGSAQIITRFAGGGISLGDGGQATAAMLSRPAQIALDAAGNVYIADYNQHRIRKVTPSGIITTIAGTGVAGYNGSGMPATMAQLYSPAGVAVDTAGNIYFSELNGGRVRKILPTGMMYTIAGTGSYTYNGDGIPATAANFAPMGMCLDVAGNIYFADYVNHRIRKINKTTGIISSVAGTGTFGYNGDNIVATAASLYNPYAVFVDTVGNIFIADASNNRVRKVNYYDGKITTIAGNGTTGNTGGYGTGIKLSSPSGVFVDRHGRVFICDRNNNVIKVITTTGYCYQIAGNALIGETGDGAAALAARLSYPISIAVTPSGKIFTASFGGSVQFFSYPATKVRTIPCIAPDPIFGTTTICSGATTLLGNHITGGTWSSSSGNATVNPSTGLVTGVAAGTSRITYSVSGGCFTTQAVSVHAAPIAAFSASPAAACLGISRVFSNSAPLCSGNSINFNGSSGGAVRTNPVGLDRFLFTMEAWVKCNATGGIQTIMMNGTTGVNGQQLYLDGATVKIGVGGVGVLNSGVTISPGVWTRIAASRSYSGWKVYKNGIATTLFDTTLGLAPTGFFSIGSNQTLGQVFNGSIDEARYWNHQRTDAQIAANMNACNVQGAGQLLGYWKFNQSSGSTATDASGNFQFLTLTNTTWVASDQTMSTYAWSLGDGTTATVNNITHTYTAVGTYTPSLTVTSAVGCTASASVTVTVNPPSAITSVTPLMAHPGTNVTIAGSGFSTSPTNNIVYFGAVRAAVTAASASTLTATVPLGATFMPITATNALCAQTRYSQYPFLPTYDNSNLIPDYLNFNGKVDVSSLTNPSNVAIGDIDGDGKPDVAVANGNSSGTISIFRSTSTSGTITFATRVDIAAGSSPTCIAIGDIDGNGKPDLVVANYLSNTVSVFRNNSFSGSISFAARVDFIVGPGPRSVAIGDMDGDGRPDLAICGEGPDVVYTLRNRSAVGTIVFDPLTNFPVGINPTYVTIGDADGDNKPDMIVANGGSASVSVLRNTSSIGSINFAAKLDFASGVFPRHIAWGDVDGDGKPDMAVANNWSNSVSVLRNTGSIGTASFAPKVDYATDSNARSVALGDINGDGKPDMVVANTGAPTISIFRNTGSSGTISFVANGTKTTGSYPISVAMGDLDRDGKPDLAVVNYLSSTLSVFRNNPYVAPPTVTSVSPDHANPGTSINITGTRFNVIPANNIVYFGATRATVTSAGSGSLTATLPAGATFSRVSVNNTALSLTAYAPLLFLPTYNNGAFVPATINFNPKSDYTTGSGPADVAIGDIDGDGKPDLAVANSNFFTVSLFRNTSSGATLAYAPKVDFTAMNGPICVVIGDIDGDGKPDLVFAGSGGVSVLRNTSTIGTVSFAGPVHLPTGANPAKVAIGDFDGDGRPELAAVSTSANTVFLFRNISSVGSLAFAPVVTIFTGAGPSAIAIADMDGDGRSDMAVSCIGAFSIDSSATRTVSVYRNTCTVGNLTFDPSINFATANNPRQIVVGDQDGDGKPDLIVCNANSNNVSVLRNTGSSGTISFAPKVDYATGTSPSNIAVGDIDGDSKPDIAVTYYFQSLVYILRNTGSAGSVSFAPRTGFAVGAGSYGLAIGDLNSDGMPDIVTANYVPATISILKNNPLSPITGVHAICVGGTGTLTTATMGGTWQSSNVAVATIDTFSGALSGIAPGTAIISYAGTAIAGFSGNMVTDAITVNALPDIATDTSASLCIGSSTTLTASGATAYTWMPGTGLSATTGSSVTASHSVTTTYTITGTLLGCSGTGTVTVTVNPLADPGTITGASSVNVGAVLTLSNVVAGGVWSSSDTSVASVDSTGNVTGVSGGTVTISYTATNGCGSISTTKIVTVNVLLETDITGTLTVCAGATTPLGNATGGGVWSSANDSIAVVDVAGVVTGITAGTATISYTRFGVSVTAVVTVNTFPAAITGELFVCAGSTTNLSSSPSGGVWSSSNVSRAAVDSGTGVVTGVTAGTADISYTLAGGCRRKVIVTVGATPAAITGLASICEGAIVALASSTSGGTWSSTDTAIATVSPSGLVAGVAIGNATISYMKAGCAVGREVTVTVVPGSIGGVLSECAGATTTLSASPSGGIWSSSAVAKAAVGATTGIVTGVSAGTAIITYAIAACRVTAIVTVVSLPATISGLLSTCVSCTSTLTSATPGGVWSSTDTSVASVGSGTGFLSGIDIGTTTISYAAGGCVRAVVVTVNAGIPSTAGMPLVCVGQTNNTLSNPVSGGTWSSSNTAIVTAHAVNGLLTGIGVGNANITYTLAPGIYTVMVATVGAAVASITGTAAICPGTTNTLSCATPGGFWSSSNTLKATVDPGTGTVTGVVGGTATISYVVNVGCYRVITQTVNGVPSISGSITVINGSSTTWGGSPGGGVWSSTTPTIASVSATGIITGNSVGATTISYTLSTGCRSIRTVNVVAARPYSSPDSELAQTRLLKVYPNPTSGTLNVDAPVSGTFIVYRIDGRGVTQYTLSASANNVTLPSNLSTGIYMCRFIGIDGSSAVVSLLYEW
jgi:uncharacterized protein YjdB